MHSNTLNPLKKPKQMHNNALETTQNTQPLKKALELEKHSNNMQ